MVRIRVWIQVSSTPVLPMSKWRAAEAGRRLKYSKEYDSYSGKFGREISTQQSSVQQAGNPTHSLEVWRSPDQTLTLTRPLAPTTAPQHPPPIVPHCEHAHQKLQTHKKNECRTKASHSGELVAARTCDEHPVRQQQAPRCGARHEHSADVAVGLVGGSSA